MVKLRNIIHKLKLESSKNYLITIAAWFVLILQFLKHLKQSPKETLSIKTMGNRAFKTVV